MIKETVQYQDYNKKNRTEVLYFNINQSELMDNMYLRDDLEKIQDEIAQDQIKRNPAPMDMVIVGSDVIFHEAFTGRYFRSNMEDVKQAVNRINHHMINNFSADLNDFYDFVGLDRTDMGDQLGWNSDKLIELEFTTIMDDQQRPAVSFRYANPPRESYFRSSM